ncbi:MAG: alcohol dehydrogenase catalytic domain-containing protein [Verrucomicrobiales bacterium]|nr:alcohol dehydrogenase catalytic domain-containing protein [Verrucomicrobiales bacterium]
MSVTAAGVCHTDLHIREGGYDLGHGRKLEFAQRGIALPLVMGHETVGEVVAAGPDVGTLDRGKKYVVYPWIGCGTCAVCASGQEQLCMKPQFLGMHVDGGYATQIRVPHPKYLHEIGDIPPENAAPLACSGLTAYGALKKVESTLKDHALLVIGAGGLGLMCELSRRCDGKFPEHVHDPGPERSVHEPSADHRSAGRVDRRSCRVRLQGRDRRHRGDRPGGERLDVAMYGNRGPDALFQGGLVDIRGKYPRKDALGSVLPRRPWRLPPAHQRCCRGPLSGVPAATVRSGRVDSRHGIGRLNIWAA